MNFKNPDSKKKGGGGGGESQILLIKIFSDFYISSNF